VGLIYLIVCAGILSLLSLPPAGHLISRQLVILAASLSYPLFLTWKTPKIRFWMGALQLLLILSVALLSGFAAYLIWYVYYEYRRLGVEFNLFKVLGWTFGESLAWLIAFDVIPAVVIAFVCYPFGYLASFQLFRVKGRNSQQEEPVETKGATESRSETS
jgi:hypothetical protein